MPAAANDTAFTDLLAAFAAAVVANDGAGLGALFTPDGVYVDELFGAHHGRAAIAAMLHRFHDTGRDYRWEFIDPVSDGTTGYARFRFSFASRLPECEGRPVVFVGISQFRFEGGLIARYSEAFDRGVDCILKCQIKTDGKLTAWCAQHDEIDLSPRPARCRCSGS